MPPEYNYRKFYALLKLMPYADKETLVFQYTKGRTDHLGQMHPDEYRVMLCDMKRVVDDEDTTRELKKRRSAVLKLLPASSYRRQDIPQVVVGRIGGVSAKVAVDIE